MAQAARCLMSGGGGGGGEGNGVGWGRGFVAPCRLYHVWRGELEPGSYIVGSNASMVMVTWNPSLPSVDRQTHTFENKTFDTTLVGGNYIGRLSASLGLS